MRMAPEFPPFALPELKMSRPLVPETPPLVVVMMIAPLEVCVPSPPCTTTAPPVASVDRPAAKRNSPPAPLVPLPTPMRIAPPRPAVAAPVPMRTTPLLPVLELPELNTSRPVAPETPEFALLMTIEPLVVAVPSPE